MSGVPGLGAQTRTAVPVDRLTQMIGRRCVWANILLQLGWGWRMSVYLIMQQLTGATLKVIISLSRLCRFVQT